MTYFLLCDTKFFLHTPWNDEKVLGTAYIHRRITYGGLCQMHTATSGHHVSAKEIVAPCLSAVSYSRYVGVTRHDGVQA